MVKARVRNMQGVSADIEDITPQYVKGLRRNNCWYYEDGYCRKQMIEKKQKDLRVPEVFLHQQIQKRRVNEP